MIDLSNYITFCVLILLAVHDHSAADELVRVRSWEQAQSIHVNQVANAISELRLQ